MWQTDRRTDGQTDGQTDRRTENTIHRAAWSQLKITLADTAIIRQYITNSRGHSAVVIHSAKIDSRLINCYYWPDSCKTVANVAINTSAHEDTACPSRFCKNFSAKKFPIAKFILGLALLTLSWDKNWDSHSVVNGYPNFYPRIALVAPSPGGDPLYKHCCRWKHAILTLKHVYLVSLYATQWYTQ